MNQPNPFKKMIKLRYFSDPGHGWLKVTRKQLEDLQIADKITSYSYARKNHVFLEEDCDLDIFATALAHKGIGIVYLKRYSNKRSKIRSYDSYRMTP